MNKWYLDSGLCLKGETVDKYLNYKLNNFKKLSMKIDNVLKECNDLNIVGNDEYINISVIETGEKLAMIELLLESLLYDIKECLDSSDLL